MHRFEEALNGALENVEYNYMLNSHPTSINILMFTKHFSCLSSFSNGESLVFRSEGASFPSSAAMPLKQGLQWTGCHRGPAQVRQGLCGKGECRLDESIVHISSHMFAIVHMFTWNYGAWRIFESLDLWDFFFLAAEVDLFVGRTM